MSFPPRCLSMTVHKTDSSEIVYAHDTIDASAIKMRRRIVLRSSFTFQSAVITPAEELSKLLMSGNRRNTRVRTPGAQRQADRYTCNGEQPVQITIPVGL